ncbi:unnamed protein product [Rotaria sordida]|uniref:Catalase core domain-containing protein n=1 Tax=Rotaria sordida TaxID=392033 RepID=A0A819C1S8_9BILA|nr:unnamed protein product [Rotaria sordida]CAF1186991.1 unnamed protein product [Rotaria sordida]CAF3795777.1 unnamed protein product [Rotaria sordida]CAF3805537.1 unnamed protein product [Rotaria sordida]
MENKAPNINFPDRVPPPDVFDDQKKTAHSFSSEQELPVLTSVNGYPIGDIMHCLQISGYPVVSDGILMEQQQLFNREKVVERAAHACGSGAFGYFEVTKDMTKYCKAKFLSAIGKKTPIFCRFSTVTYGRDYPDSARNPRGLALKFYTEDGNYDILCINFPVFFVRDPLMGSNLIYSQRRDPNNFCEPWNSTFDFMSLVPESMLANTWFWSDHGTPAGWRNMNGYACHTFKWCVAGVKNFTCSKSIRMCGEDPEYAKRDLKEFIDQGNECEWKCYIQFMTEDDVNNAKFDPFDATKMWCEDEYQLHEFGRFVLNRNPTNYHTYVEQAAFSPGSLVPGIEISPDPLLQFRCFLYRDAQMYRLGANFHQIPVNCPFMVKNHHPLLACDGRLRYDSNGGETPKYYPTCYDEFECNISMYNEQPQPINGWLSRKSSSKHEQQLPIDDEYKQARYFYFNGLNDQERKNLYSNIVYGFKYVKRRDIKMRFLICCYKVHEDYAKGICDEMTNQQDQSGIDFQQVQKIANEQFAGRHTVDLLNGYIPYPLDMT